MDELQLASIVRKCRALKHKFSGVYAADNFPPLQRSNSFQVVNADPANRAGSHWMVVCKRGDRIVFADPLGQPLNSYRTLYLRMCSFYTDVLDFSSGHVIQPLQSNMCGILSLYYAHLILGKEFPSLIAVSLPMLTRFISLHSL